MTALFPDEKEIARLVLGPGREKQWREIAQVLEKRNFPPINPLMGGRYFPAVRAFFDHENGVPLQSASPETTIALSRVAVLPPKPDGVETFDGPIPKAAEPRRATRRA